MTFIIIIIIIIVVVVVVVVVVVPVETLNYAYITSSKCEKF